MLVQFTEPFVWSIGANFYFFFLAIAIPTTCAVVVNITAGNQRIRASQTGTEIVCLRCLNSNLVSSPTTSWDFLGRAILPGASQVPEVGEYVDGLLELLPGVVGSGAAGELGPVSCRAGNDITPVYNHTNITFYSSGK